MSLKHIMLGMLREPHSGYDIKKEFEKSLRNFWRAELSQIYPLLQKMGEEGLVTSKDSASDIGPTRRIYKRTVKGRKELIAWLSDGPVVGTEKIAFLAQVYFLSDLEDDTHAIEYMQELREYMVQWLRTLEATEQNWKSCEPGYPDDIPDKDFYAQLTLDLGLRKVRANIEWCDQAITRIRRRGKKSVRSA
ncbi:MAG: PadR family transcriptional regulator [Gammaproteobacteria bacterium]